MRYLLLLLTFTILSAIPAQAQTITVYGTADDPAISVLEDIVARDDFLLLDRDTVIGPGGVVDRDVVVVRARVALEGRINGAVAVIEGEFFVRPGGTVTGSIATIAFGGAYPSGEAATDSVFEQSPRVFVSTGISPTGYSVTITAPPPPSVIQFPGLYGFSVPTYDRVNGLSIAWGADAGYGGSDTSTVAIRGTAVYRTLRGRIDGTVEASYRLSPRALLSARVGRATQTPDSWIRGDLANSLSTFVKGSDVRDYFESDFAAITLRRLPPPPIVEGESYLAPGLTFRTSRDRSLSALDPWTLMGDDDWRPNPPIDEGVLSSIVGHAEVGWRGVTSAFGGAFEIEWAPAGLGDFEFARLSTSFTWTADAIANHRVGIAGYGSMPLGSREAPLQRWSYVGGPGTLPTYPISFQRGDHVAFLNAVYLVPIGVISLPVAGTPAVRFEYLAGAAWRTGDPAPTPIQNVGAGIQLLVFKAMVYVDPRDDEIHGTTSFGTQISGSIRLPTF